MNMESIKKNPAEVLMEAFNALSQEQIATVILTSGNGTSRESKMTGLDSDEGVLSFSLINEQGSLVRYQSANNACTEFITPDGVIYDVEMSFPE